MSALYCVEWLVTPSGNVQPWASVSTTSGSRQAFQLMTIASTGGSPNGLSLIYEQLVDGDSPKRARVPRQAE